MLSRLAGCFAAASLCGVPESEQVEAPAAEEAVT